MKVLDFYSEDLVISAHICLYMIFFFYSSAELHPVQMLLGVFCPFCLSSVNFFC